MADFQFLDKRMQRTKRDLYHTLFTLLENKRYEEITVKEIADLAGYSRGTFYLHYKHKDDLLLEFINYLFQEAEKAQRTSYRQEETIDVRRLDNEPIYILRHFQDYGYYYQILLGENIEIDFRRKLTGMFVNFYHEDFFMEDTPGRRVNKELLNKYYAYGLIGLIIDWINADFPKEAEEFSEELVDIFKYTLGKIRIKQRYPFK